MCHTIEFCITNFYACWRQDMPLPRFMTDLIHIIKKKLEEAQHV